jgi:AcrR family transcriptional regulator
MKEDVNPVDAQPSLRQAQVALTEERIIASAAALFLAEGYVATTLEAVARRAGVSARTVYVRFGTKAALFKRVVDVAIVGDTAAVDVLGRQPMQQALSAASAAERIAALAALGRAIMERTGALFAVARQAAAVEPVIEEFWQQGRAQSRYTQQVFWTQLGADGLLAPGADLGWLIDTAAITGSAESYLLISAMLGWDLDAYQGWLEVTLTRLATAAAAPSPDPHPPSGR